MSPTLKASQASQVDSLNAARQRVALQVRGLLDQADSIVAGAHLKEKLQQEKAALQVAYAALAKPRRDQRA